MPFSFFQPDGTITERNGLGQQDKVYEYELAARLLEEADGDGSYDSFDFIKDELFVGPRQVKVEIEIPVRDLERVGRK
jgi:hypothetical protein